ncbi:hypothetical protein D1BOALGB6SA_6329 [Olavius sp. associated proteobacterium Delta 1]|nr:hypothetical protein D1BOALGB6SA_6329 [Olavius sp. associated proteobacterium Delta 1]
MINKNMSYWKVLIDIALAATGEPITISRQRDKGIGLS